MIRIILSFLMLLTAHSVICAQAGNIADSILSHYKKLPHEKVYVHTDKPYYAAGDTIWFRAHVADAVTNSPTNKSKFVYVELLDNNDKPVRRQKLKKGNAQFFFLNTGKYYARIVDDTNGNGKWDTGLYADRLQPESVYYFPQMLDVRALWDMRQDGDIHATPVAKQKPLEITKQKPEEKKERRSKNAEREERKRKNSD